MSAINDGKQAFPCEEKGATGAHYHSHLGLTMRDYFAAKVIARLLNPDCFKLDVSAADAYKVADAMLKARGEA